VLLFSLLSPWRLHGGNGTALLLLYYSDQNLGGWQGQGLSGKLKVRETAAADYTHQGLNKYASNYMIL